MNRSLAITSMMCLLSMLLAACTANQDDPFENNRPIVANPYAESSSYYLEKSWQSQDDDKISYQLKATAKALQEGDLSLASRLLKTIKTRDLSPEARQEKQILEAQLSLHHKKAAQAIRQLSTVRDKENLSPYLRQQYHASLADAYQQADKRVHAVEERIELDHLLNDPRAQLANRRLIWRSLVDLPRSELTTQALEASPGSELEGWLQFVSLSKKYQSIPSQLMLSIEQWQQSYPAHPANSLLSPQLNQAASQLAPTPQKVALLLPLSGPLSEPGKAIRDGFMKRYYQSMQQEGKATQVKFYDTNQGEITVTLQKALAEGADFIVGPLAKDRVSELARQRVPVRMLSLNYTDKPTSSATFYQFGLSPLDEARQVANKAWQDGHRKSLIIAPNDSWSQEMLQAYATQWRAKGGTIVETMHYDGQQNMNQAIKDLLHISQSTARERQLKALLGKKIKFIPRRRQDFDNIFLVAYPEKAREIRPLLKFYYAGDMPVYATSMIYNGTPSVSKDRDLDGITFCDMPWVFQSGSRVQASYNRKHSQWPNQLNRYARLYALGQDAFSLGEQLNQLILFPYSSVQDNTGQLYLNQEGRLRRQLQWAQFRQGTPHPLS